MKRILYIGHTFHLKTKSNLFLLDILKDYDIDMVSMDPHEELSYASIQSRCGQHYDILLCWQVMPSILQIKQYISFDKGVLFPMADFFYAVMPLKDPVWQEYVEFQIINFCKAVHEELSAAGFSSYYIQYFPKPAETPQWGNPGGVFFWQRVTHINPHTLFFLLRDMTELNAVHMHYALDPGEEKIEIPRNNFPGKNITESEWFDTKEKMYEVMEQFGLYMAPRYIEGIGMSFLEAMAHGRCVIAPDAPTMNEYIVNGETGFLYERTSEITPLPIQDLKTVRRIQENAYEYVKRGYAEWKRKRPEIKAWIEGKVQCDPKKLSRTAEQYQWPAFSAPAIIEVSLIQKIKQGIKRMLRLILPDICYRQSVRFVRSYLGNGICWIERKTFYILGLPLFSKCYSIEKEVVRYEFLKMPVLEYRKEFYK